MNFESIILKKRYSKESKMELIVSSNISEEITHACVTNCDEFGYGVFSWHVSLSDAEHNAKITGGKVVPVDYIDDNIIVPSMAVNAIKKFLNNGKVQ